MSSTALDSIYDSLRKWGLSKEIIGTTISVKLRLLTVALGHPLHVTRTIQNMPGQQASAHATFSSVFKAGSKALYDGFGANISKVLGKELYRYPLTSPSFHRQLNTTFPNYCNAWGPYSKEIASALLVSGCDALAGVLDRASTYQITYRYAHNQTQTVTALEATRQIIAREGGAQLFKGFPSLFTMHFSIWMMFFIARKNYSSANRSTVLAGDCILGMTLAPLINAFEVVRQQATSYSASVKPASMLATTRDIMQNQGFTKFTSGLFAKMIMNGMNLTARGAGISIGEYMENREAELKPRHSQLA